MTTEYMKQTLSGNLKYYRKKHDFTQETFAEVLNISRPAFAKYEERKAIPTAEYLLRMSKQMGYTMEQILTTNISHEI